MYQVELGLEGRGEVPLKHERSEGQDHFQLPTTAVAGWCAGGALTGAGEYSVWATYSEERPRIRDKLCGPAASERRLKRRKVYGFTVAVGPAAAVRPNPNANPNPNPLAP